MNGTKKQKEFLCKEKKTMKILDNGAKQWWILFKIVILYIFFHNNHHFSMWLSLMLLLLFSEWRHSQIASFSNGKKVCLNYSCQLKDFLESFFRIPGCYHHHSINDQIPVVLTTIKISKSSLKPSILLLIFDNDDDKKRWWWWWWW